MFHSFPFGYETSRVENTRPNADQEVVHRKSFANTCSTNIVEGAGHSWNPGLFVDVSWKDWASSKTDCNKMPDTFAELRGRYF